jgi:hypothetical protein
MTTRIGSIQIIELIRRVARTQVDAVPKQRCADFVPDAQQKDRPKAASLRR